jgi:hypothetical protein
MKKILKIKIAFFVYIVVIFSSCKQKSIEELVIDLKKENHINYKNKVTQKLAQLNDTITIFYLEKYLYNDVSILESTTEVFLKHYNDNFDSFDEKERKSAEKSIEKILGKKSFNKILNDSLKLNLILNGLRMNKSKEGFYNHLQNILLEYEYDGLNFLILKWKDNKESIRELKIKNLDEDYFTTDSKLLLENIIIFNDLAIKNLLNSINKEEYKREILAHFGSKVVNDLKNLMKSDDQNTRFSAAEVLIKMIEFHPDAIKDLTIAINDENLAMIASNYPFYIKLGRNDSEDLLLRVLKKYFSQTMGLDFLNCGNKKIEDGTEKIANDNGFIVNRTIGVHYGPKWGSNPNDQ